MSTLAAHRKEAKNKIAWQERRKELLWTIYHESMPWELAGSAPKVTIQHRTPAGDSGLEIIEMIRAGRQGR